MNYLTILAILSAVITKVQDAAKDKVITVQELLDIIDEVAGALGVKDKVVIDLRNNKEVK